jgi:hypothetical protein
MRRKAIALPDPMRCHRKLRKPHMDSQYDSFGKWNPGTRLFAPYSMNEEKQCRHPHWNPSLLPLRPQCASIPSTRRWAQRYSAWT